MRIWKSFHATNNLSEKIEIVLFMGRMEYVITYLWNLKVELSRRMHVSTAIINCWSSIIYMLCMVVQTSVRSEVYRSGKKLDQRTGIMHHKVCYICVHLTVAFSFVTINSYEKLSKASIMHVVVYIKIGAILRWQMPIAHVCIIVLVNVFYLQIKVGPHILVTLLPIISQLVKRRQFLLYTKQCHEKTSRYERGVFLYSISSLERSLISFIDPFISSPTQSLQMIFRDTGMHDGTLLIN